MLISLLVSSPATKFVIFLFSIICRSIFGYIIFAVFLWVFSGSSTIKLLTLVVYNNAMYNCLCVKTGLFKSKLIFFKNCPYNLLIIIAKHSHIGNCQQVNKNVNFLFKLVKRTREIIWSFPSWSPLCKFSAIICWLIHDIIIQELFFRLFLKKFNRFKLSTAWTDLIWYDNSCVLGEN